MMRRMLILAAAAVLLQQALAWADPADGDDAQLHSAIQKMDAHPEVVLHLIGEYQQDPYARESRAVARLLTLYMIRSQKVTVEVDTDVIAPVLKDHSDLGYSVLTMYDNGLLKYALGHDNRAPSCNEASLAGLKSIVEGYRNMLKTKPDGRYPFADRLLALDDQGKLASYLDRAKSGGVGQGVKRP